MKRNLGFFDIDVYVNLCKKGYQFNSSMSIAETYSAIWYILTEIKSLEPMMLEALSKKALDIHLSEIARYTALCRSGDKEFDARSKSIISKMRMNFRRLRKEGLVKQLLDDFKSFKKGDRSEQTYRKKDSAGAESNSDVDSEESAIARQCNELVYNNQGVLDQKTVSLLNSNVEKHGFEKVLEVLKAFKIDKFAKKIGYEQTFLRSKFNDFLNRVNISRETNNDTLVNKSFQYKKIKEEKMQKSWETYVSKSEHKLTDNDKDWHLYDDHEGWYVNQTKIPNWYMSKSLQDSEMAQNSLSKFWQKIGYTESDVQLVLA